MPAQPELARRLAALDLLRPGATPARLEEACHRGLLVGGLSVALDATADEVLGPMLAQLGGDAQRKLRIEDVRTGPPLTLEVRLDGIPHSWEVPDLPALVTCINEAFAPDPAVRTCVLLGEWDDMLQLWCLDKRVREVLLREHILPDR